MNNQNLFVKNLTKSNNDIRDTRATRLGKAAEKAQTKLVNDLDTEVDALQDRLEDLEDLNPDTELSLQPVKNGDFNAVAWVTEMQNVKLSLANKKLELDIAKNTYEKYFKVSATHNTDQ